MYIIQQWPIITNLRVRGLHLCSVPGFCKVQNDSFFIGSQQLQSQRSDN